MKNKKRNILNSFIAFFLTACALTVFLYKDLFHTFYQQDEWLVLGIFLHGGIHEYLSQYSLLQHVRGDSRILSVIFQYPFYTLFPYEILPFAAFSIIVHFFNSVLSYVLIILLGGGVIGAWIGGLFFLFSYNGSQAVSWFATNTLSLPSTFFGTFSLILMLLSIKINKWKYLWISQMCAIVSYYFKESGFIFILLLPIVFIIFQKRHMNMWKDIRSFIPMILYCIVIVFATCIRLFAPSTDMEKPTGTVIGGIWTILHNAWFYPVLSFSQLFIPFTFLTKINPILREQSPLTDIIFLSLSEALIFMIFISSCRLKNERKAIWFGLIFTLLAFVPYAVLDRGASYLSSRHFYVGIMAGSVLVGLYAGIVWDKLKVVSVIYRRALGIVFLGILVIFVYKNIQYIRRDVYQFMLDADERITILNQIKTEHPSLPKNPVFYITGDHPGYYFIKNQELPFQQGIGYTLMMWYYPVTNRLYEVLPLGMSHMRDISFQGYVESNGRGFGYYYDKEALMNDFAKGEFTRTDIIGYFYYSGSRILEDISQTVQNEMP